VAGLVAALLLLAGVTALSVLVGARPMAPSAVLAAVLGGGTPAEHAVVWDLRVPRTVVGLVVGPALGVCGALIQAYTRNPLADPGILGVNAGAALAVTLALALAGVTSPAGYVWFAFAGALVVTVAVYAIGSTGPGHATPEKLTLAGVALAAVLGGVEQMLALSNPQLFAGTLSWGVGSLGGRSLPVVATIAPFVVAGLVLSLALARPLNALALGDELGRSLGARVGTTRVLTIAAVTLLAGGATALAGPIAFVGLMVPHVVRWFTGPDQRWIVPYSMVVAAILLLASDIVGRLVMPTGELRVGLVTAFVGAPVLVALARRRGVSGL
jgi:iron complex transport system permease protein